MQLPFLFPSIISEFPILNPIVDWAARSLSQVDDSIANNISKLVDSAVDVCPFILKLLSSLIKTELTVGEPGIVARAVATLRQVGDVLVDSDGPDLSPIKRLSPSSLTRLGILKLT